jgi:hypothetical protein
MNIYTCPEYLCRNLVENALYFELQKNQICGCVYRFEKLRFSLESCLFRIAKINCIFSWNFYRALEMGICTCIFNFSLFEFHEFFFSKIRITSAHVPRHFSLVAVLSQHKNHTRG